MSTENTIKLADWLQETEQLFIQSKLYFGHGTDNAWDEAVWLATQVLGLEPEVELAVANTLLSKENINKLNSIRSIRLDSGQPLAYILNEAWFAGLKFYVDTRVIVPRSPIAELILSEFKPWLKTPKNILDMCTGSGCIAIACASVFPTTNVTAVDISTEALDVAKINVRAHKLDNRVHLVQSDLFTELATDKKYNLIISNPPYVAKETMKSLPAEYLHEPELALVAPDTGCACVKTILEQARNFLTQDGILIIEVGEAQAALETYYPDVPFTWLEFSAGGNDVLLLTYTQLEQYF